MVHSEREKKEVVRERICLHHTHWKLKKERGQWINLRQAISEQSQGQNMSVQEACMDTGYSSLVAPAQLKYLTNGGTGLQLLVETWILTPDLRVNSGTCID